MKKQKKDVAVVVKMKAKMPKWFLVENKIRELVSELRKESCLVHIFPEKNCEFCSKLEYHPIHLEHVLRAIDLVAQKTKKGLLLKLSQIHRLIDETYNLSVPFSEQSTYTFDLLAEILEI